MIMNPKTLAEGSRVELVIGRGQVRYWHVVLAQRLRKIGYNPGFTLCDNVEEISSGIETLFLLEKTLRPRPAPRLSDRFYGEFPLFSGQDGTAEMQIILPGGKAAAQLPEGVTLDLLFDGYSGEIRLVAALLDSRASWIDIADRDGRVLAQGRPSIEAAAGFCEAYEAVVARLMSLVIKAMTWPGSFLPSPAHLSREVTSSKYLIRQISHRIARRLYRQCCYTPHWRVGWRFNRGQTVWDTQSLDGAPWHALQDPGHRFYADPFPFCWKGRTYVFVEDFDHHIQLGIISAQAFDENGPVGPMTPVLEERFHLSYPFLFEYDGEVYMIPETSQNRTISLYKAEKFPSGWVHVKDILTDIVASDATLIKYGEIWWMFATLYDGEGAHSDMLVLFMADTPFGPWVPHPANPILVDAGCARPAGNMIIHQGQLWRPAQDCSNLYGGAVCLALVTQLTDSSYEQVVRARISPGTLWPGRRLHTLNASGPLEVIDGSATSFRFPNSFRRPSWAGGGPRSN